MTTDPRRARRVQITPPRGLSASRAWICKHAGEYQGQWIAVCDGQLLGVAESLDDLEVHISSDPTSTLVTRVLEAK